MGTKNIHTSMKLKCNKQNSWCR